MRRVIMGILAIGVVGFGLSLARAAEHKADATLALHGGAAAAGVGVSWGSGNLTYKGKKYPVDVEGLSVGDVGVTKIEAAGRVYHLDKLDDFDGNYAAVGVGATVGGGGDAVVMRNQNGVEVNIVSTTQGARLTLGGAGVSMKIAPND